MSIAPVLGGLFLSISRVVGGGGGGGGGKSLSNTLPARGVIDKCIRRSGLVKGLARID